MAKHEPAKTSIVFLWGYEFSGKLVAETTVQFDEYYDGTTPLIDDTEYRVSLGIRTIRGEIYDSEGVLAESFESSYDNCGKYLKHRAKFADGTIVDT